MKPGLFEALLSMMAPAMAAIPHTSKDRVPDVKKAVAEGIRRLHESAQNSHNIADRNRQTRETISEMLKDLEANNGRRA